MSIVKSFSVGNGDMFYIKHSSDNFTIIDCNLTENNKEQILEEIDNIKRSKGITRVVSTHPDEDHILGIKDLDDKIDILNFYCVANKATKEDESDSFKHYKSLRDHETKAFNIYKGCVRRWMNQKDEERKSAGIFIKWPDIDNEHYKDALKEAEYGGSPNNISCIIQYSFGGSVKYLWMGDLETEFMENIEGELELEQCAILFAPHHGRESGKIPSSILEEIEPEIIIIGEAPSKHLNYYPGYNTITQNSAGDIVFENDEDGIHIFTSNDYSVEFLVNQNKSKPEFYYLGTLEV